MSSLYAEKVRMVINSAAHEPQTRPEISRLPAFDAMRLGLQEEREEIAEREKY